MHGTIYSFIQNKPR